MNLGLITSDLLCTADHNIAYHNYQINLVSFDFTDKNARKRPILIG